MAKTSIEDIKTFVHDYLRKVGAEIEFDGEVWLVTLPTQFYQHYRGIHHRITFSREMAEKYDCELIAPGSHFLDVIIDDCKNIGGVSQVALRPTEQTSLEDSLERLKTENCYYELTTTRPLSLIEKNGMILHFFITCRGIDQQKLFLALAFDVKNKKELPEISAHIHRLNFSFHKSSRGKLLFEEELLNEILAISSQKVDKIIEETMAPLKEKTKTVLEGELNRIKNYYEQLRKELFEKEKYYQMRIKETQRRIWGSRYTHTYRRYLKEKDELERKLEKTRHANARKYKEYERLEAEAIEKVKAKHQVRVSAELIGATIANYETETYEIKVLNETASTKIGLSYLPALGIFEKPACPDCGKKVEYGHLCKNSHFTCEKCVYLCFGCHLEYCPSCKNKELEECYICRDIFCSDCRKTCFDCNSISCLSHLDNCAICSKQSCFFCGEHCSICNIYTCIDHTKQCQICQHKVCTEHIVTCQICHREVCEQDSFICSICARDICSEEEEECRICSQKYCSTCVKEGICDTCQALSPVSREIVSEFVPITEMGLQKIKKWQMARNKKYYILKAEALFKTHILVVRQEDKEILKHDQIGLLKKIFGRWKT